MVPQTVKAAPRNAKKGKRNNKPNRDEQATPFLKWAGGKRQLIPEIQQRLPNGLGKTITRYAEPFLGGGAVFLHIIQNYNIKETFLSDINHELIIAFKAVRDNVEEVIENLEGLRNLYLPADTEERDRLFYQVRDDFNSAITDGTPKKYTPALRAAQLIFLNRTCFNGLFRVNSKGLFNVPNGRYTNPNINNKDNLRLVSKLLQGVKLHIGDYSDCQDWVDEKTFVYFDPPYRPLTASASFTSYSTGGFNDTNQVELAEFATRLMRKGVSVMMSNSDPTNSNQEDSFFDDLYSKFSISRISARRNINSNGKGRGEIRELVVTSYPIE